MPLLSIITAVHPPHLEHLAHAWKSIETTAPNSGPWEIEWCLQEDSRTARAAEVLPDDPRIRHLCNPSPAGAAATRNTALARARGTWFVNLDADDFYIRGGVTTLTDLIDAHPEAIWIAGNASDYDRGEFITFPDYLADGYITTDDFNDAWVVDPVFPILCGAAGMRTRVACALGGYAGIPFAEDISLFAAAAQLGSGAYTSNTYHAYRQWPHQTTRNPDAEAWSHIEFIRDRATALRELTQRTG